MKTENFKFKSHDGVEIVAKSWLPNNKPKAIVQISHGMAEHIGRYHDFAAELVKNDFGVYGNSHRGHGDNVKKDEDFGYFGADQGWEKLVDDLHALTKLIKKRHAGVPVFLFAHSMGSSVARNYVIKYNNEKIQGLVMTGVSGDQGIRGAGGHLLSKLLTKIQGKKTKSPLFDKLMFGEFNKPFKPSRTDFDWLSSDEKQVDNYLNDFQCGFIFSIASYRDIIGGVASINKLSNINKVSKDLPIFLLSGAIDPVTFEGKGLLNVEASYKKAGVKDVSHIIYENCRHELLNEVNRKKIYKDIIKWIKSHC